MKKSLRRLLIAVLSLAFVLAMGSAVFADDEPLAITNNAGMFKADTAYLTAEDNQEYLVMALTGTGYGELFKGTYEQAVANGDGSAENGNDSWIHSYTNDAGKYEFKIPLDEGESFIPLVAVSNSYYSKYLNGQNPLARAFFPRQVMLDREAKTIVTDDYNETLDFAVTSNVEDFKVAATAETHVVGGPNSNNYSMEPTLVMEDQTYDKVTFPTVVGGAVATAEAALVDGKFAITMTNAPNKEAFKDKEPIEMTFHVSENAPYAEAGTDVVRTVTIDKVARTIVIDGDALHADRFAYEGETVKFIKENGDAFGMWAPQEGSTFTYKDGKIYFSIIPKNATTYGWMHWGKITDNELTKDVELSDGKLVFDLDAENCGWALPIAPIKPNGTTTTAQYYLAVPALSHFEADYTAVDEALATVPEDLSIYTEATAAALTEAVNAVVRGKKANEQAQVDAMANAIVEAVGALAEPTDLSDASIDAIPAQTYTGKALTPGVTVKLGEQTLSSSDFTAAYDNNTNAGTATVTITGKGNYRGSATATFTINPRKVTVPSGKTLTYNGKKQTGVAAGTYYTISGNTATKAGSSYKATLKLKDKENCMWSDGTTGDKKVAWKINPAAQKLTVSTATKAVKYTALKKKYQLTSKVYVKGVKTSATYVKITKGSSKYLTIGKSTGKIKVAKKTKKGTYKIKVRVTAAKSNNYKKASVTKVIKVKVK